MRKLNLIIPIVAVSASAFPAWAGTIAVPEIGTTGALAAVTAVVAVAAIIVERRRRR